MSTTQAVPQDENTAIEGELYMSFELGDKKWKLTASDGRLGPSRYNVDAGDTAAVAIASARPESAVSSTHRPGCTRATKPAATAGGCTGGCANRESTASWSIRPASK